MSDIELKARELLSAELGECEANCLMEGLGGAVTIGEALSAIIAALTTPEQFPEGWHLSERATCYVLSEGNNIVGNFVGPDAEQNAARVARMLAARPEVK
jgi:hypothetical protein